MANRFRPFDALRRVARVVLLAAGAMGVAACGGGGGGGPTPDPQTRQSIGAAGGQLSSPDGRLTLTIPAGALGNPTEITITEVSAGNVPDPLKLLAAERIFRLEPAGLQFAQPVTATATLASGNQLAVMLLVGNGKAEYAAGMQTRVGTGQRRVSGRIAHFSHLVVKTVDSFTLELMVDKRELKVGEQVEANATLSKTAANDISGFADASESPDSGESEVLILDTTINSDASADFEFATGRAGRFTWTSRWKCKKPGTEVIEYSFRINSMLGLLPIVFFDVTNNRPAPVPDPDSRISAAIDVVCTEATLPSGTIRTGLFVLPFGGAPDGIVVDRRSFASLAGTLAFIASSRGLVVIDLETALSVLNMTDSGPDRALGDNLLGVQPISRANPGRDTPAALFGTTTGGAGSYLRNWSLGAWGLTQVSPGSPYIDASNAGGAVVAEEMVTVAPRDGLSFVRYDVDLGFFSLIPGLDISLTAFSGQLRAAVLPSEAPGSPVLVLTARTDGATTSALWVHLRQPGQQGVRLMTIPGADARRLRCLGQQALAAALAGRIPCIVTEFGSATAHFFIYDPANPTATPQVQTLSVGAGALGVQLGQRANGNPWAVVSNFGGGSLNVISMNAEGTIIDNQSWALPTGCQDSAHAAPFSHGGRDYVVGTCNASDSYFVLET